MFQYVVERWNQIWFASWQHFSLVVQCVVLATVIAVVLATLVYRSPRLTAFANGVSAIGLTLPSFAVIGLLIVPLGFGVLPSVVTVVFFAALPILRNAVVGLAEIPPTVVESARGIGMSRFRTLLQVELPMAWPIILSGVRVAAQMVMGIAAIAAYALGPGLGGFIFSGLSRLGGANALFSVVVGVVGVVLLALVLDLLLIGLGRLTISRGIRVQH
ncbi:MULTISPECIES: ABC transporter permease [Curtobacterium]|uniref:ABC transporter permease n=1 Tax=Curtobacterium TaxID=2034 RepID=UPI00110F0663|nr:MULTISPECIES: ABC transporter permease [Curtobacterium]MBT1582905.1 ABC transporter permease [Curtobacterium flaccumfaciens pv. flaccumfaciens]MCS5492531.1 ABC transporter permease [Curtobacterium flaccumfaciens pv. flaccumfaciens]MCS5506345.1 ABC transporter permease [Curtobacterium flaccumfaciens pv. flaccumfaciens]MCS5519584.1 ABC transporter permease [Curtobacterium flaccumfaciens]MCX2797860.1 ABC transporter permease [Curtobacterium flaccumfaciens pv. flaccumfaciens]